MTKAVTGSCCIRFPRYTLRTLFAVLSAAAALAAVYQYYVGPYRRQALAIDALSAAGIRIRMGDSLPATGIARLFVCEDVASVRAVPIIGDQERDMFRRVGGELLSLEQLRFTDVSVDDRDVAIVASLPRLQWIQGENCAIAIGAFK